MAHNLTGERPIYIIRMGNSDRQQRDGCFSKAEMRAISRHRHNLSQQIGHDVGEQFAIEDWRKHHAARWRRNRLERELEEQKLEILKHKWIESEKAGTDLGARAILDWIDNYAVKWRNWREEQEDCE